MTKVWILWVVMASSGAYSSPRVDKTPFPSREECVAAARVVQDAIEDLHKDTLVHGRVACLAQTSAAK